MMPRSNRPRYRFRKYTRVFAVPIPRQVARAVRWSDGGTLESYLLDRGVQEWPVQAEIDLYETMPGTLPGHFTRDETLPADERPSDDEYQPLTTRTAGVLLGEPALGRGRRPGVRAGSYRPGPASATSGSVWPACRPVGVDGHADSSACTWIRRPNACGSRSDCRSDVRVPSRRVCNARHRRVSAICPAC